jgi:hypothetical protein
MRNNSTPYKLKNSTNTVAALLGLNLPTKAQNPILTSRHKQTDTPGHVAMLALPDGMHPSTYPLTWRLQPLQGGQQLAPMHTGSTRLVAKSALRADCQSSNADLAAHHLLVICCHPRNCCMTA